MNSQQKIHEVIDSNIASVKDPIPKMLIKKNPSIEEDCKKEYMKEIKDLILELKAILKALDPYILGIKDNYDDVTDRNIYTAIYLLLASVKSDFNGIFKISKEGKYTIAMTILRKISEALILCDTFSFQHHKNKSEYIDKWFRGEIVSHSECRKEMKKMSEEFPHGQDGNLEELRTNIYRMSSQPSHNGYVCMLENISPFTSEVDFSGTPGYYRTIGALRCTKEEIKTLLITLKFIYIFVIKNEKKLNEIENIFFSFYPEINNFNKT